ncbi:hypothetical protein Poli38472_001053 [Pythium oligandrum]|uniref:Uncharacterized protein n=1 Tax=Pythium oligandrum TaxID=41045 RepID=A0A8K1FRD8_PYTOL|nr:hypothetical protein Poli38472_001053 [Pythium oligandrum]|eukprot:TMW68897.1 hypothetical protein Poli38472_001053 [Pythium oligandrum]
MKIPSILSCLVAAALVAANAHAQEYNTTDIEAFSFDSLETPVLHAAAVEEETPETAEAPASFSWKLKTGSTRTISGVKKDPADSVASSHGGGSITISTDGIVTMKGSPRYYLTAPNADFLNVEMISYGRLKSKKKFKDLAGMTMVTRSNHGDFGNDPCQAMGYYSRIYFNTGEFAFQKEFFHENQKRTIYTASRRQKLFDGGFPVNKWVGMKFVLQTNPDGKSVSLKGYVDMTGGKDGGDWKLAFETTDNGGWKAMSTVPSKCGYKADEVVLRAGKNSYFRTDDVDTFEWKNLSVRTI